MTNVMQKNKQTNPKNLMLGKKYKQNKNDKRQTGKIFATFITKGSI